MPTLKRKRPWSRDEQCNHLFGIRSSSDFIAAFRTICDECSSQSSVPMTVQQVARETLKRFYPRLSDLATNTTAHRTFLQHVTSQMEHVTFDQVDSHKRVAPPLRQPNNVPAPIPERSQQPTVQVNINMEVLRREGFVVVPKVFSPRTVNALRHQVGERKLDNDLHRKWLRESEGNGCGGLYYYFQPKPSNPNGANALVLLQKGLANALYGKNTADSRKAMKSRFITLGYSLGGENFTHQDQQHSFKYQALVLLSTPKEDFNGGELYIQDGAVPRVGTQRRTSRLGSAGDVVVFQANKGDDASDALNFYHGMTKITQGTNEECERWAIGLFQPPTSRASSS